MSYDPERITFFAKTDARGQHVPFGIKAKDRTRHVYVIGKTGMGKSTLLENMAIQDIRNGEGIAFIDPHGQTAETLLSYVPEERVNDVLYFAPFDMEHPVSFNVMEDVGPDKRHLVVSGLMSVFEKIWVDAWSARMAYILQNTLMALLEYPGSTLLGVNRMLSDKAYRDAVVANIKDPSVRSFWVDEFAKYNERYMQEAGDAIKNKIGQFTANPLIRNIIGQPKSSFDIRKIMDEKKILIMNLSKGLVGETNANLLGSMLTTRIYLAAMSRADLSVEQMKAMPNFYFYVDEFQSFANATFANILSEARKYKLNLTIAHQYIEQMEEDVRNAVFGNVGTTIAFRVGPFDAEILETIFSPQFTAVDICNLGFAQIYLSLMIDGIGSHPFSAVTLPPIVPAGISYKDMVIEASRRQFAHDRASVESDINTWHSTSYARPSEPRQSTPRVPKEQKSFTDNSVKQREREEKPPRVEERPRSVPQGERNDRPVQRVTSPETKVRRPERSPEPSPIPILPEKVHDERSQGSVKKGDQKQLSSLREVLANLAHTQDKEQKDSGVSVNKQKATSIGTDNGIDLKAALARAIQGGSSGGHRSHTQKAPPEAPRPVSASITPTDLVHAQDSVSAPSETSAPQLHDSSPKRAAQAKVQTDPSYRTEKKMATHTHDPLDPKMLERMMRVTTDDRTPLR